MTFKEKLINAIGVISESTYEDSEIDELELDCCVQDLVNCITAIVRKELSERVSDDVRISD